ncbi:MAG: DUF4221 family protein [Bacteroidia bacterium]
MRIYFLLFVFIYLATGCNNEQNKAVILEEARHELTLLPDSGLHIYSCLCTVERNGQSYIALYDSGKQRELFFELNGKQYSAITLNLPDTLKNQGSSPFIKPLGTDSLLALWPNGKMIFLFNSAGKIIKQFTATVPLKDKQENYSLVAMNQSPLITDGKNLFVTCTRLDVIVRTADARKIYFRTPPDIRFSMENEEQENTGIWPGEYKSGMSFRDFYPQRCVNGKGEIVYGFSASDSIFVMKDNKFVAAYNCKSRFMTMRHSYPDDSIGHFSFLQRYDIEEPGYVGLVYDAYRNYYYRIVSQSIPFEKPGGMIVNTSFDKPWSLLVMDENFIILNEIMMDNTRFLPMVLPVKEGLLLKKIQQTNSIPPVKFALFKFK